MGIFVRGLSPTRGIDLSFIRKLWENEKITASSEIRTRDLTISSSCAGYGVVLKCPM